MTHRTRTKKGKGRARAVPRCVGAAAEAVLSGRGDAREVKRALDDSHVPMVLVDAKRRFVAVNRPARLVFRLSLDEMRTLVVEDLAPPQGIREIKEVWARL